MEKTATPSLPEPGVWTGMASANVLEPLRWKRAKTHRGSRHEHVTPHQEAGYTSAVVVIAPENAEYRCNRAGSIYIHTWVESRCGAVAVDGTYLLPPLSSGGASLVPPWLRFHIPLIEPDMQISRIRLSDKTSRPYACAYFRVQRHRQFLNTHRS
jgi:hypothetical protein